MTQPAEIQEKTPRPQGLLPKTSSPGFLSDSHFNDRYYVVDRRKKAPRADKNGIVHRSATGTA